MVSRIISCALLVIALAVSAGATTYYVDGTNTGSCTNAAYPTGGTITNPWCTIAASGTGGAGRVNSTNFAPDDTVLFVAGIYDEVLTPSAGTVGTLGHQVVFSGNSKAATIRRSSLVNKSYVTLNGFRITTQGMTADTNPGVTVTGSTGCIITNFTMQEVTSITAGIRGLTTGLTTGLTISNGVITHVYSTSSNLNNIAIQIQGGGSNILVDNVEMTQVSDGVALFGVDHWTVRNSLYHGNPAATSGGNQHNDFVQGNCNGVIQALNYGLMEGNSIYDMPDADTHGFLVNTTSTCGGASYLIFRRNAINDLGVRMYVADNNDQSPANTLYHKIYNNSIWNSGTISSTTVHNTADVRGTSFAGVYNNIFMNAITDVAARNVISVGTSTTDDYNMGCFYLTATTCNNTTWATPISAEANGKRGTSDNPRFVDPTLTAHARADLHLQPGSPAIDAGGPLTTVDSMTGSGTSITLTDAAFFQDGWGGVTADCIAVGTATNTACISSINYGTNVVSLLSSIAWTSGDPVYLYKNSSGTVVLYGSKPDMGAYETVASCAADHLTFTAQPSSTGQGLLLGTVSVGVYCSDNTLSTDATNSITLALGSGCSSGTLNGTKTGTPTVGIFSSATLTITGFSGDCTLTAAASGLTGATSNSFTISISANGLTVGPRIRAGIR